MSEISVLYENLYPKVIDCLKRDEIPDKVKKFIACRYNYYRLDSRHTQCEKPARRQYKAIIAVMKGAHSLYIKQSSIFNGGSNHESN